MKMDALTLSVCKYELFGVQLLNSPPGLYWKAGPQGVQIFGCSPGRRPQSEYKDHIIQSHIIKI